MAEVLADLPARLTPELPEPPTVPPQNDLIDLADSAGVRFPVLDDAATVLEASPLAVGADYRETAQAIREGAFAITGDLTTEAVGEVRELLAETLARGGDFETFADDVTARLGEGGPLSPARLDTIFRAVTGSAISNGMEDALAHPVVVDEFPYRRYFATRDHRVRPEHIALEKAGLNGTGIYSAQDPAWLELRPPFDFNCRCSWAPMSITQAAKAGVVEAQEWLGRAEALAEQLGGSFNEWLSQAAPPMPARVPWPTYRGNEIHAPPEWSRSL
jgi:SPP1 gp7 family putative phage head morphogenesis protein